MSTQTQPVTAFAGETAVDIRNPLIRFLDATGTEVPADAPASAIAILHLPQFGLMFDVRAPKRVKSLKIAQKHAAGVALLGRKGDWTIGERAELQLLVDTSQEGPAVHPRIRANFPSVGWVYSATPTAWSSDHVWFVSLHCGVVCWGYDGLVGLAVPVLRVPPSQ